MADEWRKFTGDKLDYVVDWTAQMAQDSDTIASVAWLADPATGIDIDGPPSPSNTTITATVWIQTGTVGQRYEIFCTVTTAAGRIHTKLFYLTINQTP